MKKSFLLIASIALIMSSCSKSTIQNEDEQNPNPEAKEVLFSGNFKGAPQDTRTTLGNTNLKLIPVYWTVDDEIGIFTYTSGATAVNARGSLIDGAGQRNGKFSSMSVEMAATGNEFYLYYPFNKDATGSGSSDPSTLLYEYNSGNPYVYGALPAAQVQPAPSDLTHFSEYGYSVAKSAPVDEGETIQFEMEHILTYLELAVYGSGELGDFAVEEITVTAAVGKHLSGPFKGYFDGTYEEYASPATSFTRDISLSIENPRNLSTNGNDPDKFLISMLPIDLSQDDLKVVIEVVKGTGSQKASRFYAKTLAAKDFKPDHLTRITTNLDSWIRIYPLRAALIWEEGVTLDRSKVELVTGTAANDLSSQLANSYILSTPGDYSIPAMKPDGTWVDGVDPAEYNHINFTIPAGAKGNALIGVYRWDPEDASGSSNKILYSWHIWMSDPQDVSLGGVTILDRDLGATGNSAGDVGALGNYYQWGRKDPFLRASDLPAASWSGPEQEGTPFTPAHYSAVYSMNTAIFGPTFDWTWIRTKQSYNDTYNKPTGFIDDVKIGTTAEGLTLTEGHKNMPSYNSNLVTLWPAHADPCPKGYHVATRAEFALMTAAGVTVTRDNTNRGTLYNGTVWFPWAGYRNNEFANLRGLGGTTLRWSNEPKAAFSSNETGKYAYTLADDRYSDGHNGRISGGRNVRCVKN